MSEISFTEDVFLEFAQAALLNSYSIDSRDIGAINNFYIKIAGGDALTEAQAKYIIKLLKKYYLTAKIMGISYGDVVDNPRWKKEFRVLDLSKKIFVSEDDDKNAVVCLKFPYVFKALFEKEFLGKFPKKIRYHWDHEKRINIINLYDVNLILLHDFCKLHLFEIDDSFLEVVAAIEEVWEKQYDVIPHSTITDGEIVLVNAAEDALAYWNEHKTDNYFKNMFMAKLMDFPLRLSTKPDNAIEAISSSVHNNFWINDFRRFFDFYKKVDERVAILLDNSSDTLKWLEEFVHSADEMHIPRSDIKICFREDKGSNTNFNSWVKENNLGGKVDTGRIFIFRSKPAKWLLSEEKNVNIVVTNGLFPSMNITTQHWMNSRPCVIYLGSIKASQTKDKEIVQV